MTTETERIIAFNEEDLPKAYISGEDLLCEEDGKPCAYAMGDNMVLRADQAAQELYLASNSVVPRCEGCIHHRKTD